MDSNSTALLRAIQRPSPIPLWSRKTFYRGIEMRSRTEANVAAALDLKGLRWEYEPCAFGADGGQYLPDFVLWFGDKTVVYVEVKGFIDTLSAVADIQQRMEIIWRSDRDAVLMLWEGWPTTRQWAATFNIPWHESVR